MKRFTTLILAAAAVMIGANWAMAQMANPDGMPADMESAPAQMDMSAQPNAGAYYDNNYNSGCGAGCDTGCGTGCDTCDPCAGRCYNCYNGVGLGYGCGYGFGYCGAGVTSAVHCAAETVLTPVHWVASLLSCGTFADCGCAPLPCRTYSDPCDNCGNWQGNGGCGCEYGQASPANNNFYAQNNNVNVNNNANTYAKVDIRSRQPQQRMMPAPAAQNAPQQYVYQEQPVSVPQQIAQTSVVQNAPQQYVYQGQPMNVPQQQMMNAQHPQTRMRAAVASRSVKQAIRR